MNKLDELIGQALTDEDRALLASHGEPGYLTQAFGIFRGPLAWVMWFVNFAGGLAFIAGAYAVWKLFGTTEPVAAVQWGIGALFLFQVTTLCKTFMGNQMQTNRMLREMKRLELQISLLRDLRHPVK
ncbi:MAG: DUF6768 family protein [Pseudolabrys sp.]|nr:hypothetical protein [Xanthomonadales bacterium]